MSLQESPSPADTMQEQISILPPSDQILQAKKNALSLLKSCFDSQLNHENECNKIISDVSKLLDLPESFIQDLYSFEAEEIINQNYFFKSLKEENQEQSIILCEICDKPLGDFISCKICSLNFHSKCIRPKISNTSDEEWTCPYCILDNSIEGDKQEAKKSIRSMIRVANGLENDDGIVDCETTVRLGKANEYSILHAGKKFIVKKNNKKLCTELGRFSSLDEALNIIPQVNSIKKLCHITKKQLKEEELFCTYCMDDPSVNICCFCGCKLCFGKFEHETFVICEKCKRETHRNCLVNPKNDPSEELWYCDSCTKPEPVKKVEKPVPVPEVEDIEKLYQYDATALQLRHEASYQFSRPVLPPLKSHKTLKRSFSTQEFVSNKRIDGYNRSYSFEESDNEYNEESSIQCTFNLVEQLCEKKLLPRDKERLDVMRLWSPLGDLEKLFNQMLTQRDNLIKKFAMVHSGLARDYLSKNGLEEEIEKYSDYFNNECEYPYESVTTSDEEYQAPEIIPEPIQDEPIQERYLSNSPDFLLDYENSDDLMFSHELLEMDSKLYDIPMVLNP